MSDLSEDNLVPNDGGAFARLLSEPEEQVEDRNKEKAETYQALPLVQDIVTRLEERIAFYDTLDSIPPENRANEKIFMRHWDANQLTRDNLRSELNWLEGLIEDYTKPQ